MKRKPATRAPASPEEVAAAVKSMRADINTRGAGYRGRSLKLHGAICGRCGREFPEGKRHLLTVHHKDGNAANNPPDGSNWENLCVDCHDAEHSRELLGDYEGGRSRAKDEPVRGEKPQALGSFAELFAKAGGKGKAS